MAVWIRFIDACIVTVFNGDKWQGEYMHRHRLTSNVLIRLEWYNTHTCPV